MRGYNRIHNRNKASTGSTQESGEASLCLAAGMNLALNPKSEQCAIPSVWKSVANVWSAIMTQPISLY